MQLNPSEIINLYLDNVLYTNIIDTISYIDNNDEITDDENTYKITTQIYSNKNKRKKKY